MKKNKLNLQMKGTGLGLLAAFLCPAAGWACACGCGVFDVATSAMLPEGPGGMAFLSYDYMDQNTDWGDTSKAPGADDSDKEIRTSFFSAGLQYFFNRSWGVEAEFPWAYRDFKTISYAPGNPLTSVEWVSLGDIRLHAIYTGFSPDMASGLTLGVRLPTGDFSHENLYDDVDRDSQVGSGSTDALVGGFTCGNLTQDGKWGWYAQGEADLPILTQGDYRPGFEISAAAGINYSGLSLGRLKILPIAQLIGDERTKDWGADANSPNSGYSRLLVSPAIELHLHPFVFYADVEFPIFAHVNGDQLVAPTLFKVNLTYMF